MEVAFFKYELEGNLVEDHAAARIPMNGVELVRRDHRCRPSLVFNVGGDANGQFFRLPMRQPGILHLINMRPKVAANQFKHSKLLA